MNLLQRIKSHWLYAILVVVALSVSGTWAVLDRVQMRPMISRLSTMDQQIGALEDSLHACQELSGRAALDPAIVLEPTLILPEQAVTALSGQVLVRVDDVYQSGSHLRTRVYLYLQERKENDWNVSGPLRKTFEYRGQKYILDVLSVSQDGVKVSISKEL